MHISQAAYAVDSRGITNRIDENIFLDMWVEGEATLETACVLDRKRPKRREPTGGLVKSPSQGIKKIVSVPLSQKAEESEG